MQNEFRGRMLASEEVVAVFGEAAMFSAQLAGPNRVPAGMNAPGAGGNVTMLRNLVRWLTETR